MVALDTRRPVPLPKGWLADLSRDGYFAANCGALTDLDLYLIAWELNHLGEKLVPGQIADLKSLPDSPHLTLSKGAVPFHNDGAYRARPPRYLLLYCRTPGARGGETLFARGDQAVARLDAETQKVLARRIFRTQIDQFAARRRLVVMHPRTGIPVLFFGNPSLSAELQLTAAPTVPLKRILEAVQATVSDPELVCYRHRWKRHDLLIFDNYTLLHARTAYQGSRLLRRLEVSPE
jgi:alpha-ketoglutarate-dependent taurine dioxygenase